jgi:hypothetical protein
MTNWQLIIETYNALPEADRTSHKVHEQLLKERHSVSHPQVRAVLGVTVLGDIINEEDVRVTVRTLNTLLDLASHYFHRPTEPSTTGDMYANALTDSSRSVGGPRAYELMHTLARLMGDYQEYVDVKQQLDFSEYQAERRRHSVEESDVPL